MSASDAPAGARDRGPGLEETVMAAHDEEDLVIADVTRDDAWLVVPAAEAPELMDWR